MNRSLFSCYDEGMENIGKFAKGIESPRKEYIIAIIIVIGLCDHYFFSHTNYVLFPTAIIGAVLPFLETLKALRARTITIEAFNFLAIIASFVTGEFVSASFIALMLTFAAYLDWKTESQSSNAVEELLKLKPNKAYREVNETIETIATDEVNVGDILVVEEGERVPVDGVIVYGASAMNEASITGESVPVEKKIGDSVYSSTIAESGVIKVRATNVGEDSTIARMATLIIEAAKQKSKGERLADQFAVIFLPIVVFGGLLVYFSTHNLTMTVAFFLVVCADDIAVSIPLAVTASLGHAAKRGVIIKGGEWLDALATVNILAFDKTGTLTYGNFEITKTIIDPSIDEREFWKIVGAAEKFSEHPTGRAMYKVASSHLASIPDPESIEVIKGEGVIAVIEGKHVVIGNEKLFKEKSLLIPQPQEQEFLALIELGNTMMGVFVDGIFKGMIAIADTVRADARQSIQALKDIGVRIVMLTGDNEAVAQRVSQELGIDEYHAKMTPQGKLEALHKLSKRGIVAMVGDGVNDAPALARAHVGIAMGAGGTATAVETANIVILTDQLNRIPEMILHARRTVSVVHLDMGIWLVTNVAGVALVFLGILGPALAAFYNFATDFLPLLNSARLFRSKN